MRRRTFIPILGSAAAVWPVVARAQQLARPVIGLLSAGSAKGAELRTAAFRQGLAEVGYIEDRNVRIDYRAADNQYDRLSELAAGLIRRRVDVIVAVTGLAALAAKAASTTIPIVFVTSADPVSEGLVASMSKPESNLTGITFFASLLIPKHLELLHALVPKAATIALLVNPGHAAAESVERDLKAAAPALGRRIHVVRASADHELDAAFTDLAEMRAAALIVTGADPFIASRLQNVVDATTRLRLPAISHIRAFVEAGGLLSYGASFMDAHRQSGIYAGRVLKGAKPSDLPIIQPTKFELIINLKTAKALNLTLPDSILARADEMIE